LKSLWIFGLEQRARICLKRGRVQSKMHIGSTFENDIKEIDPRKAYKVSHSLPNRRTGKDFPKYGAPGSFLSGRKWWPLPAYVMMSSHFLHTEGSPLQISFQYPH